MNAIKTDFPGVDFFDVSVCQVLVVEAFCIESMMFERTWRHVDASSDIKFNFNVVSHVHSMLHNIMTV